MVRSAGLTGTGSVAQEYGHAAFTSDNQSIHLLFFGKLRSLGPLIGYPDS
jgi:hypothetical protein